MSRSTVFGLVALGLSLFLLVGVVAALRQPPRPESVPGLGSLPEPDEVYDPVAAGERLPDGFRQVLPRDAILPVYDPAFVPAAESGWHDSTLVIGVAIDGEAKAYPVSFLNRREMVVDRIAGIPVLVTW